MAKKTQKTHKGLQKITKVRSKNGKITSVELKARPGKLHKSGKKSAAYNRDKREKTNMSTGDFKRLKSSLNK